MLKVESVIKLVNADGHARDQTVGAIDWNLRSEYVIAYNAMDGSGNEAEEARFSLVLNDPIAPVFSAPTPPQLHLESCDIDNPRARGLKQAGPYWLLPTTTKALDNYDGTLTKSLKIQLLYPDATKVVTVSQGEMGGVPIKIDTTRLGETIVTYSVHDHAGMFGRKGTDNYAVKSTKLIVADTVAPLLYCKKAGCKREKYQFSRSAGLILTTTANDFQSCCDKCEQQQWKRRMGTSTRPDSCAYFRYSVNKRTNNCHLHSQAAWDSPLLKAPEFSAGHPVQCQVHNIHACNTPFHDAGARCIDMRDSMSVRGTVSDTALEAKTTIDNVNANAAGKYSIVYTCKDTSGNVATPLVRTVQVQDLSPPTIAIRGNYNVQLQAGLSTNLAELQRLSLHSVTDNKKAGYYCTDTCAGGVEYGVEIYRDNCAGKFDCMKMDNGQLIRTECDGGSRVAVDLNDALQPGTFAFKYSCGDKGSNHAAAKCRTVFMVDTPPPPTPSVDDCKYSEWGAFGECSATCGPNQVRRRTRTLVSKGTDSGVCDDTTEKEDCYLDACPVHCEVSEYGNWGSCTEACGGGVSHRERHVKVWPNKEGRRCPRLRDGRNCNTHGCIDCEIKLQPWGPCSKSCGGGTQIQPVQVVVKPSVGGGVCPVAKQRMCNAFACPTDCMLSSWEKWEPCTKSCISNSDSLSSYGTRNRKRRVVIKPALGGKACPSLAQKVQCGAFQCPTDGECSPWGEYSECSKTCELGTQSRTRSVVTHAAHGGHSPQCTSEANRRHTRNCYLKPCAVDCVVSKWAAATKCSAVCAGGLQERHRSIITASEHEGKVCPSLREEVTCNAHPCPVDCVGGWDKWSTCSASCGTTGSQKRMHKISVGAEHGGEECPTDLERVCNTHPCPSDCKATDWTAFSECTQTCGMGIKTRVRKIINHPSRGGKKCPCLEFTASCNSNTCPTIDCKLSGWSEFGSCSAECGTGVITRSRSIIANPANGGAVCPSTLTEAKNCEKKACPVHCMVVWNSWPTCDKSCGGGTQTRDFIVTSQPANGGAPCPTNEEQTCNAFPCPPVPCALSAWTVWSECSAKCGTGTATRSRSVMTEPMNGGTACEAFDEIKNCNTHPCPVHCAFKWHSWSSCSADCGGGKQTRSTTITKEAAHGGDSCPANEERVCNTNACPPVDCKLSSWSDLGSCSEVCGVGVATRTRSVLTQNAHGGSACGSQSMHQNCNAHPCPVHCVVKWDAWSACDKSCASGMQTRKRSVLTASSHGGATCPPNEQRACNVQACPAVHCRVSGWAEWGSCSTKCGAGVQMRSRSVISQADHGGHSCPTLDQSQSCEDKECPSTCSYKWSSWSGCSKTCGGGLQHRSNADSAAGCAAREDRVCNAHACPKIDCKMTGWSHWSTCSADCGAGVQTRSRSVVSLASNGGSGCPPLTASQNCNTHSCAVHCAFEWNSWLGCSKSCGGGIQTRDLTVTTASAHGGRACPSTQERTCNHLTCPPVDCEVSIWSDWDECSALCGLGLQSRSRSIVTNAQFGGTACDALWQVQKCKAKPCPVNCKYNWGEWSKCSKSCSGGTQTRHNTVTKKAAYGGMTCPSSQDRACNNLACPVVECEVSEWSTWTRCSTECGNGIQTSARSVVTNAAYGGKACPLLSRERDCVVKECPVHCAVEWNAWSTCSQSCGGGMQTRGHTVMVASKHGGRRCPDGQERTCSEFRCAPKHCEVSGWTEWAQCSEECGEGVQTRTRSVISNAANGGEGCEALYDIRSCAASEPCSTDCEYSWSAWTSCSASCGGGIQSRDNPAARAGCPSRAQRYCNGDITCPAIDCKLSGFSSWDTCSAACGPGVQTRSRSVITSPSHGGNPCSALSHNQNCLVKPCPVHCVFKWAQWSSCSESCGSGKKTRDATAIKNASHGGLVCPGAEESTCNTFACPAVTCEVSMWSEWDKCSQECGSGVQSRSRSIVVEALRAGLACPALSQSQKCNDKSCPVDCMYHWGEWSACSKTCGGGQQLREHTVAINSAHGGKACPMREERMCSMNTCPPVDCDLASWGSWSSCSTNCGNGVTRRARSVATHASNGGKSCGALVQETSCTPAPPACPVHCEYQWDAWSACSKTCGGGQQTRTLTVTVDSAHGGRSCPAKETRLCNKFNCPAVDCKVSTWGSWGGCSAACGNGLQRKSRSVTTSANNGGNSCPSLTSTQHCELKKCAESCEYEWGAWSVCSKSCGGGTQTRENAVVHTGCPSREQRICKDTSCPKVNCKMSGFSQWDACSAECNGGVRTRSRSIITSAAEGGNACGTRTETQICNFKACPVDCKFEWGAWSTCSKTCGGGMQRRDSKVSAEAANGGSSCPSTMERTCNEYACPAVDCRLSGWEQWATCTAECGPGVQVRKRSILTNAAHGGVGCEALSQQQNCYVNSCPDDCKFTWGEWTACTKSCGAGKQMRHVKKAANAQHGGAVCPTDQQRKCNDFACPTVECKVAIWGSWEMCSAACGPGVQMRSRSVVTNPSHGGSKCPKLEDVRNCEEKGCPEKCEIEWAAWSACSVTCGGGQRSRENLATETGVHGESSCPSRELRACNGFACPVMHCKLSSWSSFSDCSHKCGTGSKTRTRSVVVSAGNGGDPCNVLTQDESCNKHPCAVHCSVAWQEWSACSATCGVGRQIRGHKTVVSARHGGKRCPETKSRVCNLSKCLTNDCKVSPWGAWAACSGTCGAGVTTRMRTMVDKPSEGGKSCPPLSESKSCENKVECAVHCVFTWSGWSTCSKSCGGGITVRMPQVQYHNTLCTIATH
jgi:hypothetical protein